MPDWDDDAMADLDGPRPLPSGLRRRLEQALGSGARDEDLPLGEDLSSRLEDVLTDPLAAALAGIDGPRPLPDASRARLEHALRARHRAPRWLGGAAAALLVVVGVTAGLLASTGGRGAEPGGQAGGSLHAALPPTSVASTGGQPAGSAGAGASSAAASNAPAAIVASPTAGAVPRPQVTGVRPVSGPTTGGTWVTVTGSGLQGANAVTFGGKPALSFTVLSGSQLRAEAPGHGPGTVDVQVSTPSGTSSAVAGDRFTYLAR